MGKRADDERSVRHARALLKNLADALEEERSRKGLTKTAYAKAIGISAPSYSAWRNGAGNPTLLTIARVADRLGWDELSLKTVVSNAGPQTGRRNATATMCTGRGR